MQKSSYLKYAASVATGAAGILHLSLVHPFNGMLQNTGIFFLVSGIAQLFWIIPVMRNWHKAWFYLGIGGTVTLIVIWTLTRATSLITPRPFPVNQIGIIEESFQVAFIGLATAILIYKSRVKRSDYSVTDSTMNKNRGLILSGVVVAVILAGLFVPLAFHQPNGPPQQFGSSPPQFGSPPQQSTTQQTGAATSQTCTLTPSLIEVENTPQQTEGPYFVDEMLDRSDIRSDPSDGSVQGGIPLRLVIHVYNVNNGSCIPLSGAHVDIWHTNSQGLYSDIQSINTLGKKYLRGYQVTDDNGTVRFTTIYPGWYEGRALHIHIKVRTFEGSEKTFEWASQFYLNDSISNEVQSQLPYSNHGPRPLTNNVDFIYTGPSTDGLVQTNSGGHLMLNLTKDDGQGYVGTFNVVANQSTKK